MAYRLKGTAGPLINQSFPLTERLVIGNARDCDIRLEEEVETGRFAEISLEGEGTVLFRGLGPGPAASINGEDVTTGRIRPGDEIRLGRNAFLLQAPGMRPERMLGAGAAGPGRKAWPWLAAAALGAAAALLAWRYGWLGF